MVAIRKFCPSFLISCPSRPRLSISTQSATCRRDLKPCFYFFSLKSSLHLDVSFENETGPAEDGVHVRNLSVSQDYLDVTEPSPTTTTTKRPYGYWKDKHNVLRELAAYMSHREHEYNQFATSSSTQVLHFTSVSSPFSDPDFLRTMPTEAELRKAGLTQLAGGIRRLGWANVAKIAGLKLSSVARPRSLNLALCSQTQLRGERPMKPYCYWRDFTNLQTELQPFIKGDCLPSAKDLISIGRSDICRAVARHGGWYNVASRLGVKTKSAYKRELNGWNDMENVLEELRRIMKIVIEEDQGDLKKSGAAVVFIPLRKYHVETFGKPGFVKAINKHGGFRYVLKELKASCENGSARG